VGIEAFDRASIIEEPGSAKRAAENLHPKLDPKGAGCVQSLFV